jgi:hypothetical protein
LSEFFPWTYLSGWSLYWRQCVFCGTGTAILDILRLRLCERFVGPVYLVGESKNIRKYVSFSCLCCSVSVRKLVGRLTGCFGSNSTVQTGIILYCFTTVYSGYFCFIRV